MPSRGPTIASEILLQQLQKTLNPVETEDEKQFGSENEPDRWFHEYYPALHRLLTHYSVHTAIA
jgi:hypothetical protein